MEFLGLRPVAFHAAVLIRDGAWRASDQIIQDQLFNIFARAWRSRLHRQRHARERIDKKNIQVLCEVEVLRLALRLTHQEAANSLGCRS